MVNAFQPSWAHKGSIIEPSARGASEVRRLWLSCLELEPADPGG